MTDIVGRTLAVRTEAAGVAVQIVGRVRSVSEELGGNIDIEVVPIDEAEEWWIRSGLVSGFSLAPEEKTDER